jgi:hypothetical protein
MNPYRFAWFRVQSSLQLYRFAWSRFVFAYDMMCFIMAPNIVPPDALYFA